MPIYWSRFFNSKAAIATSEQIRAQDDAAAVATARLIAMSGDYAGLELWEGKRLVWRERDLPPHSKS
jgi:hypothetical protein